MRWKNAWILTRKDIDEFKKQKLVIGSIIAMPLVLGIVLPLVMFIPAIAMTPIEDTWDVDGLLEIGDFEGDHLEPWTNQTLQNISLDSTVIYYTVLKNVDLHDCVLVSCIVENSTLSNSTILNNIIEHSQLNNVFVLRSEGIGLDGKNILSVNSGLAFTKTKESKTAAFLPMALNTVLMLFIIVPATLPTIIASYSIVGEKNNRSLEPLLATPITDGELLVGKMLSSFLPTMISTIFAFVLSVILIDIVFFTQLGYLPLPTLTWILSILLLAPLACLMSILACVLVSSKVTDVRAAQQVGGFVIMPVIVLMLGVVSGFVLLSPLTILIFAGIYCCIDLGLFYFARAIFNREDILVKWT